MNNKKAGSGQQAAGRNRNIDLAIWSFAILAVFSAFFSIYKHDSIISLLKLFGYIGIFYLITSEFSWPMKRGLLVLAVCVGCALSLYGILQYFDYLGHSWWHPKQFLSSTYVNHNHFAGYLEFVIPVLLGLIIYGGKKVRNKHSWANALLMLFEITVLLIILMAFIFTQSRGGWIGLLISLFVMSFVLLKRKLIGKKLFFLGLLLGGALLFMGYYFKGPVYERAMSIRNMKEQGDVQDVDSSLGSRFKIWQGAYEIAKAYPWTGTGIGTFVWAFPRYMPVGVDMHWAYAHNDYLQMAAEMGVLAPVIMLWFFGVVIINGYRGRKTEVRRQITDGRKQKTENRGLTTADNRLKIDSREQNIQRDSVKNSLIKIGCTTGVLSLVLHGAVDFNFHIPANMILFTVYCAIVMSGNGEEKDN